MKQLSFVKHSKTDSTLRMQKNKSLNHIKDNDHFRGISHDSDNAQMSGVTEVSKTYFKKPINSCKTKNKSKFH